MIGCSGQSYCFIVKGGNKMLEQKIKLVQAMNQTRPKSIVYELYQKYCESYEKMRKPNEKDKRDYVDLYFKYMDYMNKLSGSQK